MTDAQAREILEGYRGFPDADGDFRWFHPSSVSRVEVVDDVLTVEISLGSDSTDYVARDLAQLFEVEPDAVETRIDGFGCESCGHGTVAVFTV